MSARPEQSHALVVVAALRELGREERLLIEQGRLDELDRIVARRAELLKELDRELKPGWPAEPAVHAMLELVRREGAENLELRRRAQPRAAQAAPRAAPPRRAATGGSGRGK
jgi:hypothetical protein